MNTDEIDESITFICNRRDECDEGSSDYDEYNNVIDYLDTLINIVGLVK